MTVVLRRRADIDLEAYRRVAWAGEGVHLHEAARARMAECRRGFMALIDSDPEVVVYGVTSGYGQQAHLRFTPEERRAHAARPPHPARASFGRPLPGRVVRGIVLARLANYLEGHAAISPGLAEAVAALLDGAELPEVAALGNGAPGEILPLSHLFAALAERVGLAEKDGLALVNGSPVAAAMVADAALAGARRLALAEQVFAASAEALQAPLEHFDPALGELWGDADEAAALAALRGWLEGAPAEGRRPYQAPVSWRILPRVLGRAHGAVRRAEEVAATSLRAVSDNPVYLPPDDVHPDGRVLSNGGFHNAAASQALDGLAASWADLALLCDRHVSKLLDGNVSRLPHQLAVGGGYLGCLGFAAAGFAEQARRAAGATLLPGSEGGGFGQNDVASPTFQAWRGHDEAAACLEAGLAALAAVVSQAFHATGREAPARLRELLRAVRAEVPPVDGPRALGPEVEGLARMFGRRVLAAGL